MENTVKTASRPVMHKDDFERLEVADVARIKGEIKDVLGFLSRQVFNQIPSVSAISGILVGTWAASHFTTSPLRGFLAEWGIIKGGTHVVSSGTFKFLSVLLPIIVTGITAYAVNKGLKAFREMRLEVNMSRASRLSQETQAEIRSKLELTEKAKEAGILTQGEYDTKVAFIYQSYAKKGSSKIEEMIMSKVASKLQ